MPARSPASLPGPNPIPFVGDIGNRIRFHASPLRNLVKLGSYGPVVGMSRGNARSVFIFRPELNMQVFNNPDLFRSPEFWAMAPPDSALSRLWKGLVAINGPLHRSHRRMLMPSFHKKKVESYRDSMVAQFQRMLEGWKAGETRDIFADMRRVTLLVVTQVLFGIEDEREVASMGTLMADWLLQFTNPWAQLLPFDKPGLPYRRLMRLSARGEAAIRELIARKRAQGADGNDVLSMLLQARDEEGGAFTDAELVGHTNILFVAGHETTTNAMTWTLLLLDQHPEVQAALVDEIDGVLRGGAPTLEQLEAMPLLDRVIKESMRLIPPVPVGFRISTAPFELNGYGFDAETTVYYSPYITHRQPDLYPEPNRFLPDRWLQGEPPVYGYIPFINGPRRCIGATMATMELKLLLPMILS
ncbi:MAG TPA: cytochrome P450, partial [Myxococcaceae bacterium]|nr:cytochrome P450 [Myxococcaceae bacterium]